MRDEMREGQGGHGRGAARGAACTRARANYRTGLAGLREGNTTSRAGWFMSCVTGAAEPRECLDVRHM